MKILFINQEYPPVIGGGGIASSQIAEELAKYHDVSVITSRFKGLEKYEVKNNVHIYRVPVFNRKIENASGVLCKIVFIPFAILQGISLIKEKEYNIINTHFVIPSGAVGFVLSKLLKTPNIISIHGGDIYDPSKKLSPHRYYLLRKFVKFLLDHSNKIIAQSKNTKNNAVRYYKPNKNIEIIPLGFVEPNFKKFSRKDLKVSEEEIILISIGRLVKRKGYNYAIEAIAKLPYQNVKYLIVGDGPEKANLENLAKRLGVSDKVIFLGFLPEEKKFQYLSISDIYVLSSLHEGFGICLLEAMYCGLPIVATNNGGQTDFLEDGENGFLVPVGDADLLAKKIEILYNNSDLRQTMSHNNLKKIKDFYIKNIAVKYDKLFKEIIEKRKKDLG